MSRAGRIVGALFLVLLAAGAAAAADLRRALDRIADRPGFSAAQWGIEVRSLRSGRVLYARNAGKSLKPASTLKLVPTAAALEVLGPEARIETTLETAGRQDALGRILGDVYLVGRGDPNLSGRFTSGRVTAAFEELAGALEAAGVRRIEGRLIGHEGLFPGERRGEDWAWDDLVWWYGAEVSALSFNDNCVDLTVSPGERAGDPALVDASPPSAYYALELAARTRPAGGEPELALERAAGTSRIRLSGTLPLGAAPVELNVALEDPARYATTVLAEVLAARDIRVTGGVATSSEALPAGLRRLAAHASPTLAEMVREVNKHSQNLHSEMLLRLLGSRVKGDGSAAASRDAALEVLARLGVPTAGFELQDGSGLSRSDLVTPTGLVALLAAMDRHRHGGAFRDSLPVAGVDGSLRGRFKGTPAEGRVQAKSGGIRNVSALAGYATTRLGERLAFAILLNANTLPAREGIAAIDEMVRVLVER